MSEKSKKSGNTEENTTEQTTVETTEKVPKNKPAEKWTITVKNNPNFVGKGAGGVQFANGKAETPNKVLADWFRSHEGYEVKKC